MKQNGKGSKPRPLSISREKFAENWDVIFGKEKSKRGSDSTESNK